MRTISKLTFLLTVAIATACNVTQDNNRSLDYDTLEVNFSATLLGGTWGNNDAVGIVATCTREGETDVVMNTASVSAFSPVSEMEAKATKTRLLQKREITTSNSMLSLLMPVVMST